MTREEQTASNAITVLYKKYFCDEISYSVLVDGINKIWNELTGKKLMGV